MEIKTISHVAKAVGGREQRVWEPPLSYHFNWSPSEGAGDLGLDCTMGSSWRTKSFEKTGRFVRWCTKLGKYSDT